jgi:hypothetical protein
MKILTQNNYQIRLSSIYKIWKYSWKDGDKKYLNVWLTIRDMRLLLKITIKTL